jgi:hypothetical protein
VYTSATIEDTGRGSQMFLVKMAGSSKMPVILNTSKHFPRNCNLKHTVMAVSYALDHGHIGINHAL